LASTERGPFNLMPRRRGNGPRKGGPTSLVSIIAQLK
jgi:hypothetical protein